jgi:UDP-glucose-4-epimerase GalE
MRILVTGGSGYVGRFCVRELLASGHEVVVLDRVLVAGSGPVGGSGSGGVVALTGDIADRSLVPDLLREQRVDAVLHLAAEKSVERAMREPGPHLANNVCGSLALLEAMRTAGVRKIVFSSSAAVYGIPEQLPVGEDAPLRPENPYGSGKVMVEQLLHWYNLCHGFDSIALRYFNAAGAAADGSLGEELKDAANLVPKVMKALLDLGGPVPVFGTDFATPDGTAIRDYVHVEDLATAHVRAINFIADGGGEWVVNLGTGRGHSVREVLRAAERVSGRPVPYQDTSRRAGDPAAVWADVRHAERVLDWRAERDLDEIMRSAWLWHSRRSE